MSFKPSGAEAGPNTFEVQLAGLKLRVHTHSFLGFGQDTAQALAASASVSQAVNLTAEDGSAQIVDPCLPTGYAANEVVGSGNFGLCRAIAAGLLAGACNDTSCPFGKILPLEGGAAAQSMQSACTTDTRVCCTIASAVPCLGP